MSHYPQTFVLTHPLARKNALEAVQRAPEGHAVILREPVRNDLQNRAAHAALADIAAQVTWKGMKFDILTWKRLTMASFLREIGQQPELIPALDGQGFDIVFERTSQLGVKKFAAWLTWIHAFGAQNGVVFRDRQHEAA